MANTPAKSYDLGRVQLSVGGQRIEGFGPDAAVAYERSAPLGTITTGADGQHTFSRSNNHGMIATITCMETSLGYKKLAALQKVQASQYPISALAYSMYDPGNGDRVVDQYAVFIEAPAPSKGAEVGTREFKIFLPNAGDNALFGDLISI